MKIGFITLVKVLYWTAIHDLCRYLYLNHITDKYASELLKYWESRYRNKISFLLRDKCIKMFGK